MVKVKVTRADIKKGEPYGCFTCPIALAIRRHVPDLAVRVTGIYADGYRHGMVEAVFALPRSAQRFVMAFDMGKRVKPFTFILVPK